VRRKAVIPRARADRDVEETIQHYLSADAADAALGFVDALEEAYDRIALRPAMGSPRYGHELSLPGLRHWALKGYPHLVFYAFADGADHVDVWRVLHGRRDIPASLSA
jgi:toxin ParE1/3/4